VLRIGKIFFQKWIVMIHLKGEEEPFVKCAIFCGGIFLLKVKVLENMLEKYTNFILKNFMLGKM
jgi:hypothetical protein